MDQKPANVVVVTPEMLANAPTMAQLIAAMAPAPTPTRRITDTPGIAKELGCSEALVKTDRLGPRKIPYFSIGRPNPIRRRSGA